MKKIILTISMTVLLISFTGCATLFNKKQVVTPVTSTPVGAKVYVDGNYVGVSPVQTKFDVRKSHVVTFKKEGYETQTYTISNSVGAGWIVLDVLGGFVPVIVDAATGAWHELDQDNVNVLLQETK